VQTIVSIATFPIRQALGAGARAKNAMNPTLALSLFVLVAFFAGTFLGRHYGLASLSTEGFAYMAVLIVVILLVAAFFASVMFGSKKRR